MKPNVRRAYIRRQLEHVRVGREKLELLTRSGEMPELVIRKLRTDLDRQEKELRAELKSLDDIRA